MTPEGKVKASIKAVLKDLGAWFYMPIQNGMGVTGIPDFIACYNGRFVGIEAKAPGKSANTTANQRRQLNDIEAAEGIALVVATTDKEAIKQMIVTA